MRRISPEDRSRALRAAAEASKQGRWVAPRSDMKYLKRLQNPFVLVGQGFVLGGILFFATHPESLLAAPVAAAPAESVISTLEGAR